MLGNSSFGFSGGGSGGGGGGIGGGGTLNYIAKFSPDGTNIANSLLFDNGVSVGLGTITPDASSFLDITSVTKGLLPPRMTTAQRNAILTPATGLFIYNLSTSLYNYFDGSVWQQIDSTATSEWLLDGNSNGALRYIGTNDAFDFPFYTNGVEQARITTTGDIGIGTSNPNAKLNIVGVDSTLNNFSLTVENSVADPLFNVRNDGFVGIGTSTWLNAFNLGNLGISMPFLFIDMQNDTGVANFTIRSGNFATSTVIGTYNATHGLDGSKIASIEFNDANGNMSFGGFGYTGQKFDFQLNSQNTNIGTPQRFAIGSGLHTIDTGGNIYFYGASNSVSNTQFSYSSIQGLKENSNDADTKGYLNFSTSDGTGGALLEAARFNSEQNLVIGATVAEARLHVVGVDATVANFAFKAQDNVGSELLCVRNDGFVGIGTTTGIVNVAGSTFSVRNGVLWTEFMDSVDVDTGLIIRKDENIPTAVRIGTRNGQNNEDPSKVANIYFDNANGYMSFGGYPYSFQKFAFNLNYQDNNAQERFVVGCGLHTINTGGNVYFYGASTAASNSQYQYASIEGLKENATDTDVRAYLKFSTSNGNVLVEAARFDSEQNFVIGATIAQARFHNFGMFNNVNQRLEPITGVTEDVSGATVNTTNATPTVLQTIAIPLNTSMIIKTVVKAIKTAGVGVGTVGQSCGFERIATYQNISGVVTIAGVVQTSYTGLGIAGFDVTLDISGTNVIVNVTGAVSDNVTWTNITRTY